MKGEDVRPFVKIANHLLSIGLSAPKIYDADESLGVLLIEDLGDALYARVLAKDDTAEMDLYQCAIDALLVAHKAAPPQNLSPYDADAMTETALLSVDWYGAYGAEKVPTGQDRAALQQSVYQTLTEHMIGPTVLTQRDYHAENLIWLPDRDGPARVGLLDFQDAMLGDPAYDLASLLKDARRDVSREVQRATLERYCTEMNFERDRFSASYAACSAQRNLRILGVFTRLCVRDGKPHYPDLLPRVWRNLQSDLQHPALRDLAKCVGPLLPNPSPDVIAKIKQSHV